MEYIFSWPGVGLRLLEAIEKQDINTVVSMTLLLVMLFVLASLFLEAICLLVDPRDFGSRRSAAGVLRLVPDDELAHSDQAPP